MTNIEAYATAEKLTREFDLYCKRMMFGGECHRLPNHATLARCRVCQFRWLFLDAFETKKDNHLLPCPICGGETEVESHSEGFNVRCKNHNCYVCRASESRAEAIAMHNRLYCAANGMEKKDD